MWGVFFSSFLPPLVWCIVKHIFSLPSLSSCENIFSVKHLLEECGDRAGPLPVGKAAEWYTLLLLVKAPSRGGFPTLPQTTPSILTLAAEVVRSDIRWTHRVFNHSQQTATISHLPPQLENLGIMHGHSRDTHIFVSSSHLGAIYCYPSVLYIAMTATVSQNFMKWAWILKNETWRM